MADSKPSFDVIADRYAVVGNPIGHSRSPVIHAMFAEALGHRLIYERILAPTDQFVPTVQTFFARGGRGLNVTVPFKREAWALAAQRTPRAETAGAVNTLWMQGGALHGDNTDGIGLVRDLIANLQCDLAGARVLLVGAGGAARGVLQPLVEGRPAELVIVNRTRDRADELAALARTCAERLEPNDSTEPLRIRSADFLNLPGAFDLVINATSAGLVGEIPPLPPHVFAAGALVYDMMYGSKPTLFLDYALALGATRASDGLGMLVEQAAESFFVWRGARPSTPAVIDELRHRLRTEAHQAL